MKSYKMWSSASGFFHNIFIMLLFIHAAACISISLHFISSMNLLTFCVTFVNFLLLLRMLGPRGTWVAQSVKRPTLDFGSGHDLMVCEFEPRLGLCADSLEPTWDSLSLPLPHSLPLSLSKMIK